MDVFDDVADTKQHMNSRQISVTLKKNPKNTYSKYIMYK